MRVLKSVFAGIFLFSAVFYAASDVLCPQDMSRGAQGSGVTADLKGKQEVRFKAGGNDSRYPLAIDLGLRWNTFMGGTPDYYDGSSVAVDSLGNIYVTGTCNATWGSPIRPFSGSESNAFVAKFDACGALQWNTFLGGAGINYSEVTNGTGIAVDSVGNVSVTGYSGLTWGSPIRAFTGWEDVFVAKLDANGNLWWNTFLGSATWDEGHGITVDTIGNVYVTGQSYDTWGSPVHPFNGRYSDAFVAKLNTYGTMQWNTFLQNNHNDGEGNALAVDASANVYVTGDYSDNCHGCSYLAGFVAKFNPSGAREWNTVLGDKGFGIAVDASANVYVIGEKSSNDRLDALVAKLDAFGILQWNTLLGEASSEGRSIALDTIGNIYVAGRSWKTWGSPIRPFAGGYDAYAAKLNSSGTLQWNAFLGGAGMDFGYGLALDPFGNVYVTGTSVASWGSPIRSHSGKTDVFVAKIGKGYNLTISSGPHGTTDPKPGTYSYDVGTSASVSAIADSECVFDRWTGDVPAGQQTSATISILMNAAKSIKANFTKLHKLTIASGLHGTTNPAPGTYFYYPGSSVSVSAIADGECVFDQWTGDVPAGQETSATVSILMNAQKSIRANFKLVSPPSNLEAARLTNRSVTQTEYIIDLTWAANPDNTGLNISTYRVYQLSGNSWIKIADLSSNTLSYRIRNVPKAEQTFGVASVTGDGVESAKTTVVK